MVSFLSLLQFLNIAIFFVILFGIAIENCRYHSATTVDDFV